MHNFTVRNNTFVNCNTRYIDVGAWDAGDQCLMRENHNILIEGNTFKHYGAHPTIHRAYVPQCPIAIAYSDGVTVRDNTFEEPAVSVNTVKVLIQKSGQVTVIGNHNLPERAIERW